MYLLGIYNRYIVLTLYLFRLHAMHIDSIYRNVCFGRLEFSYLEDHLEFGVKSKYLVPVLGTYILVIWIRPTRNFFDLTHDYYVCTRNIANGDVQAAIEVSQVNLP